jgi:outer membrane receptor protein involved in Fe transport
MQAVAQTAEGTTASRADRTETLEEVIVTAERRTSDVQKTPASVSVHTGEELAAQGRYTTRQILEDIPGLTAVDNSSLNVGSADVQGNNFTIRGVTPGTNVVGGGAPSGISPTPGTAVYVDGVYEGVGSGYDIDRVELLRGPQGTLYGRSATSGVLAFHTRNPILDEFIGNAGVEFGNYDLQHYTAAVNIPLGQGLAARVSGDYRDQAKGYYRQANQGMSERTNGRAKLLWEPNDAFSLLVGFAYQKFDAFSGGNSTTAAPPTLATTTTTTAIFPGQKLERQYWAEANWDLGPVTITYAPAYRTWEQDDHLLTAANFISTGAQLQQKFLTPTDNFHTQELRVASSNNSAVQWQAGGFFYHNQLDNSNRNFLVGSSGTELAVQSLTSDQKDTKALGYFAETTFPLAASMRMTLGARYDDTQVVVSEFFFDNPYSLCGTPLQNIPGVVILPPGAVCIGPGQASVPPPPGDSINDVEVKFHNFNYKARLEYDLTQKNMLYGMVSTGFRPGDARIANRALNIVAAEKLTSIEVGSKNRFLDDSLQLNVGLYYYKYRGFRTSYIPDTASPADFANFRSSINLNVPATNVGGELELLYQLTAHDRVGLNYNYVESRWTDKPAGFAQAQTEEKRALTPTTISANYEHVFYLPGGSALSARIDGRYEAAHLTENLQVDWLRLGYDQYVHVGSRTIGNLTGTWSSDGGRYSISAYVRNFTDKRYIAYDVAGDPTSLAVSWTDPRTYGAVVSVRF